jgi:hypothetical protein
VVGGEQRLGLTRGERLDPEWGGERDQRAVEAVGRDERSPAVGIVVGRVERRLRLSAHAKRPAGAPAQ